MSPPLDSLEVWPSDADEPRVPGIAEVIARLDATAKSVAGGRYAHKDLLDAAREISGLARGSLQIEQALVAVKEAWRATPGRARRQGPDETLDLLITLCIREYYGRAD